MKLTDEQIEIIAKAIGYHFWFPESDKRAIWWGMDCTKEIVKALENEDTK